MKPTARVALLRAVNVGGRNRLPMADLRVVLAEHGLDRVSTVLQSGNVLFHSAESEAAAAARIGKAIVAGFDLRIGVIVRSAPELAEVVARNPFLATAAGADPATLYVTFLADEPDAAAVARLDPERSRLDSFVVDGREVYLRYPDGSGRSRLTLDYLERQLGTSGTARNWRTTERLASLLAT